MNTADQLPDTTQDTISDRLVSTIKEAILSDEIMVTSNPDSWLRAVAIAVQEQIAAELIACEEQVMRPLSLQDAVAFILQEVEA